MLNDDENKKLYYQMLVRDRMKKYNIKAKNIKDFSIIYMLEVTDLDKLLSINWDNQLILESLIKTLFTTSKIKNKKLDYLKYISSNTNIEDDEEKIKTCIYTINRVDLFDYDYEKINLILNSIINSKTEKGAQIAKEIIKNNLEYIEDDYDEKTVKSIRKWIIKIIELITLSDNEEAINTTEEVLKNCPKEKMDISYGIIKNTMKTTDKKQLGAILDITRNKGIRSKNLELITSSVAATANDIEIEKLYEIISYSDYVTKDDLLIDLDSIVKETSVKDCNSYQRKKYIEKVRL